MAKMSSVTSSLPVKKKTPRGTTGLGFRCTFPLTELDVSTPMLTHSGEDESFFQEFFSAFFRIFFPVQGSFSGFFFRRRLGGQFSYWCIGVGRVTEKYREFYRELRNIELQREMQRIL